MSIVLVAHGSPDPRHEQEMRQLTRLIQTDRADSTTLGFLEHNLPGAVQALDAAERDGSTQVDVVGLFLSAGHHARKDLPDIIESRSTGQLVNRGHLGIGTWLIPALEQRLHDLVGAPVRASTGVVLVAAGSADPDAREEVMGLARTWQQERGGAVRPAFASGSGPSVEEALSMLTDSGYGQRVVALLMLAPGVLADRVIDIGKQQHVPVSAALGASDHVVDRILELTGQS